MQVDSSGSKLWDGFLRAVETEPKRASAIRGASGHEHRVLAVGHDEQRSRIVIVSPETDPRLSVFAESDIEAKFPGHHVLVVRPVATNVPRIAAHIVKILGGNTLKLESLKGITEDKSFADTVAKIAVGESIEIVREAKIPWFPQWIEIIRQLTLVRLEMTSTSESVKPTSDVTLGLDLLANHDPLSLDREVGICGLPLFDLTLAHCAELRSGDPEAVASVLRDLQVMPYFFPQADAQAIGLIEKLGPSVLDVSRGLNATCQLGHPFESQENNEDSTLIGIIDQLQSRGLLVRGDMSLELTPDGQKQRQCIQFMPREGVVSKVVRRISVAVKLPW